MASFELEGVSYRLLEGGPAETADLINLFPSATKPGQLELGKPFARCFRICRDVTFPAPPKPIPVNPLGRAPRQLEAMRKNFFPIGFLNEKLTKEWNSDERQGRVLRSTSARPQSPRLFPLHGFDLAEWRPAASSSTKKEKASSAKSSKKKSSPDAMEVDDTEEARKKAKKEAKKRAAAELDGGEKATKKQKSSSSATTAAAEPEKEVKAKKAKKEKQ